MTSNRLTNQPANQQFIHSTKLTIPNSVHTPLKARPRTIQPKRLNYSQFVLESLLCEYLSENIGVLTISNLCDIIIPMGAIIFNYWI